MNTFNGMVSDLDTMLAKSADTQAWRFPELSVETAPSNHSFDVLVWKGWNRLTESYEKSQGLMLDRHLTWVIQSNHTMFGPTSNVATDAMADAIGEAIGERGKGFLFFAGCPCGKEPWFSQARLISTTFSERTGLDEKQRAVSGTTAAWVSLFFDLFASCLIQGFSVLSFATWYVFLPSHLFPVVSMFFMQARPRKLPLEGNHIQSAQLPRLPNSAASLQMI